MNKKIFWTILTIAFVSVTLSARRVQQTSTIDSVLASQYLHEAQAICSQDNGELWGKSLCGPLMFADRKTHTLAANQADSEGRLTKEGDIFVGALPQTINIANTSIDWAGTHWTLVAWPLPENKNVRAQLMIHEMWHRIQADIGLPSAGPANNHLDLLEGRIWLQLEWRALQTALKTSGAARKAAIKDALTFRSYRRERFPNADAEERALEMHEGLADYTGMKLSGRTNVDEYAASQLKEAEKNPTFVRSFAYASGPAYGLLLDDSGASWRKELKPTDDFGAMMEKAYAVRVPQNIKGAATAAARKYDGDALRASETERENNRSKRIAQYRARLVVGAVLVLPLRQMQMQFDPDNLQPLEPLGTVYPNIRIVDVWGILTVTNGALMSGDFTRIYVVAPASTDGQSIRGDGWTLELNSGWAVTAGERKGDFTLKKP